MWSFSQAFGVAVIFVAAYLGVIFLLMKFFQAVSRWDKENLKMLKDYFEGKSK